MSIQTTANWRDAIAALVADREGGTACWRQDVESWRADGFHVLGLIEFKPGDCAETRFGTKKIVRVNKNELSVEPGYAWTDTLPYDEVCGRIAAEAWESPASLPEAPAPRLATKPEPALAVVVTAPGLQTMLPDREPAPVRKGGDAQPWMS